MKFTKAENIIVYENGKKVVMTPQEFDNAYDKRFDKKSGKVICTRKKEVSDNIIDIQKQWQELKNLQKS